MTRNRRYWITGGVLVGLALLLLVLALVFNVRGFRDSVVSYIPGNTANFTLAPTKVRTFDVTASKNTNDVVVLKINDKAYIPATDMTLTDGSVYSVISRDQMYYINDNSTLHELGLLTDVTLAPTAGPVQLGGASNGGLSIIKTSTYTGTIDQGIILETGIDYARLPFYSVEGRFVETGMAKELTALDVQRLNDELGDSFVRRIVGLTDANGVQMTETLYCSTGMICTVTLPNGAVRTFIGMGKGQQALQITEIAMTVRIIASFDNSDAVYSPCTLAKNEDAFGRGEDPSFPARSGNFECNANGGFRIFTYDPASAASDPTMVSTPAEVAKLLLGDESLASNITIMDGTNGSGFKYEGPKVTVTYPGFGEVIGDGWTFVNATPKGTTQADVTVFSFYRDSKK